MPIIKDPETGETISYIPDPNPAMADSLPDLREMINNLTSSAGTKKKKHNETPTTTETPSNLTDSQRNFLRQLVEKNSSES